MGVGFNEAIAHWRILAHLGHWGIGALGHRHWGIGNKGGTGALATWRFGALRRHWAIAGRYGYIA